MSPIFNRRMSITTALIVANVVVFVVQQLASTPALFCIPYPSAPDSESLAFVRGAYSWFTCFMEMQPWRLITYQFLHAGPMHLVFNMWALYFFGPAVEEAMGQVRYLAFYLSCGVAGALFSSLLASLGLFDVAADPQLDYLLSLLGNYTGYGHLELWQLTPMVGASAAIYGVLVAVAFLYPHLRISLIFPPVTLTLRSFALIILGLAVLTVLVNGHNAGGEAGHLGGIILSAIIMLIWKHIYIKRRNNDRSF